MSTKPFFRGALSSETKKKRVAVAGGGIAGLSCAQRLQQNGLEVVLFDTGKRGPGGRASSRDWKGQTVDHACQIVAAKTRAFATFMESLVRDGAATSVQGAAEQRVGSLGPSASGGNFVPTASGSSDKDTSATGVQYFLGRGGNGAIATYMSRQLEDARQDVWISPNAGVKKEEDGRWSLIGGGRAHFDMLIIAHNGKCAERLTSRQPSQAVHTLLRARFNDQLPGATGSPRYRSRPGDGKMTLNSVYSLLFEVQPGIMPDGFDYATIVQSNQPSSDSPGGAAGGKNAFQSAPVLASLGNNTTKYGNGSGNLEKTSAGKGARGNHIWTALSSASFGKQNKVAQEHLSGTEDEKRVTAAMLAATEEAVGIRRGQLSGAVVDTKLQLWGAGLPINHWNRSCLWDAEHNIGVAGDWLCENPSVASTFEGAWLSGQALADHIVENPQSTYGLDLGQDGGQFLPTFSTPLVQNVCDRKSFSSWVANSTSTSHNMGAGKAPVTAASQPVKVGSPPGRPQSPSSQQSWPSLKASMTAADQASSFVKATSANPPTGEKKIRKSNTKKKSRLQ